MHPIEGAREAGIYQREVLPGKKTPDEKARLGEIVNFNSSKL